MNDILSQIIAYAPNKIDTETKARSLVQGPRNMYNQGQLVQPNADGSRPGYNGEDVASEIPKIYDDELLKKRISIGRPTGPTSQAVTVGEIFEKVKNVQGGPELISDFKKNPTEEKFISLRKKYKNRVKTERIQNLSTKEKAKFRKKVIESEKKWRASEKGQAYYNKLNATKGIFPANTPQERVWRDIYRAASQKKTKSRFQVKYPKNIEINPETGLPKAIKSAKGNMYIPWDKYYKQISFYDTKTGSTIKFGNMREWMKNNVKGGGKKYDNAIGNYKIRQSISDFNIGGQSLGDIFKQSKSAAGASPSTVKRASPSAVNHISGLDNFWDTEITTSTGNQQLNDKVQSKISAYKNSKNPIKKEKILKEMKAEINKIKGGATLVIDGQTIGKPPTLKKVSNALAKELDVDLLKLAGTVNPKCRKAAVDGGRIGFQDGLSADFCINEGKKVARDLIAKNITGSPAQNSIIKRITSGVTNFAKSILDPKELFDFKKQFLSKGALIGAVGIDAIFAADDALRKDMDPKEAFAKTLTFGTIPRAMGFTDSIDVINAKKMLEDPNLSPAGKEYAQLIIDSGDYEKMQKDTTGGMTKKFTEFKEMQEKIKNASTSGRFDYENALAEMQGTFKAKPKENKFFFDDAPDKPDVTPLTNKLATPAKSRGPMTEMKKQKVDLTPTTYQNYKPYSFTKEEFEDTMRQVGVLKEGQVYNEDFYKEQIETPMKASQFKEYMELPSFRGANEKFSEGGIASLNVNKK